MKIKKKHFVIGLSIIGFILIIVATYNFSFRIPELDKKISETNADLAYLQSSHILFHQYQSTGILSKQNLLLLAEIQPNSSLQDEIIEGWESLLRSSVLYLHHLSEGNNSAEYLNEIMAMNYTQLSDEILKYAHYTNVEDKIRESKQHTDDKQSILRYSVILQILGLFISQIAVILRFTWKKEFD